VLGGFWKVTCMIVSLVFTMKTSEYQNLWWDQDGNQLVSSHPCENQPFLFLYRNKKFHGLFFTFVFFNFVNPCFMLNCESSKLSDWSFVHFMICEVLGVNFLCLILSFMSFVALSLRFGIHEFLLFMNFVDVHHCLMLLFCHLLLLLLIIVTSYCFAINYWCYVPLPSNIIVIIEP
jgi:hypothetical protein